jgi:hypothetical protein
VRKKSLSFALCSLLICVSAAFGQGNPRTIIERAIHAQGGEAKIAKLRAMRIKVEGTTDLIPGQPNFPITVEDIWKMPGRYKSTSSFQLMGNAVTQIQTIDGDTGWAQFNGQTQDLPREAFTEMKEQKYAEDLDRLSFLNQKGIELSALDEIKVDGKLAVGVRVKSKGHRDVKLYFDKSGGLLVKRQHNVLDPASGKEVSQEVLFSDFQDKDGIQHYRKIVASRDGKKMFEGKVTELEFFDKLEDKVFARP